MITLEEITSDNLHAVLALEVSAAQKERFPRANAYSIAEGFFPPDIDPVWMRAICKAAVPVGFMMTSEVPEDGAYFLWRMMIDSKFQGKGYGTQAMQLLIKRIKNTSNPRVLLLSHMAGNAAAAQFYQSFGFSYTGNDLGNGDLEMALCFREL